jgi:beta-phosphoglucomutase-like phosphatase (HAD superfamily)
LSGRIKGVVFGPDGTLLDSIYIHTEAWRVALERNGFFADREKIVHFFGIAPPKLLRFVAGEINDKILEKIETDYTKEVRARVNEVHAFPDSKEALWNLKKSGIKCAVASLNDLETAELMLDEAGILDSVDAIVGSDEVTFGRPDPDIFLEGFRRIGVNPSMGAVVGHTEYDALSARKINAFSIIIRRDGTLVKSAELVFRSLRDAIAEIVAD